MNFVRGACNYQTVFTTKIKNGYKKGYKMDYRIIRVTLDIAVPDYGGKYQASGMDYIDVHSDAQSLGFAEQEMQSKSKYE